jgi:eight-cysteine-cluster-containing protein
MSSLFRTSLSTTFTVAFTLTLVAATAVGCRKTDDATPPTDGATAGSPCEVEKCGPAPGMPNGDCGDGTMSGPSGRCLHNGDGSCGWEILECANGGGGTVEPEPQPIVGEGCQVGGCSGTLCTKKGEDVVSTCEWREEYACYRSAECKVQTDGNCGWTQTEELKGCLAAPGGLGGGAEG